MIFQLLHLWLGVLGLFVAVLTVTQGLGLQKDKDTHVLQVGMIGIMGTLRGGFL